jgi:trimeric autotransporter adhesin
MNRTSPNARPFLSSYSPFLVLVAVAALAGFLNPLVLRAQNSGVWAWQDNYAAVFVPQDLTNATSVAASVGQSFALKADGTVTSWGDSLPGRDVLSSISNAAAISMGFQHGLVLLSNGTAVAWGAGPYGENIVPAELDKLIAIAAGGHYNLALKSNGTVVAWGQPGRWLNVPAGLSNVIAIAANAVHNDGQNLALKSDGTVIAWGSGYFEMTNVPVGLSNVIGIAVGDYHCLALRSDSTVVAWGRLAYGGQVPAGLTNVVAIAAGAFHNLALKSDGAVVSWKGAGMDVGGAENVPAALSNVTAIAAGRYHSLAISLNVGPYIRIHPQGQPVWESIEDGFHLYAEARGTPPLTYQWQKDGVNLPGQTNSDIWVSPSVPTNGGDYRLVVTNPYGSATSHVAGIEVRQSLGIFEHPASQTVYAGEDVTFSVHVKGTPPFQYQWRKHTNNVAVTNTYPIGGPPVDTNAVDIPRATNATLTLTNVQPADALKYDVVVMNVTGAITSQVARLTVDSNIFPAITTQPQSLTVWPGAKAGFRVTSKGAPTLQHQWRKSGSSIYGATNVSYLINSADRTNAGTYDVVVSNTYGALTSSIASLAVAARAAPTYPPAGTVVNLTGALLPDGLTNIVAVSAARYHALALRSDGTVAGWGAGAASLFGLNTVPEGLSNIVAVSAGSRSSYAIRDDGTVASWGNAAPELFGIVGISGNDFGGVAVQHGGRVIGWGMAASLNSLTNIRSLSLSFTYALVVYLDGTVQRVGLSGPGAPLTRSISTAVAAAIGTNTVALTSANEVVDLLSVDDSHLPSGLKDVIAISGYSRRNLALKSDGTVVGWGNITVPLGLSNVTAIAAGDLYTLVVTTNPPQPALAGTAEGNQFLLSAPVAVSGYVLEATDDLSQPYTSVGTFTNTFDLNESNSPAAMLPISGGKKFFRFRKL